MTALRELAERWKARASNAFGFHAAKQCADELLSILDAEGDGGAVYQCMCTDPSIDSDGGEHEDDGRVWMDVSKADFANLSKRSDMRSRILYTHPQPPRSGVVSDEQVESTLDAFDEACRNDRQNIVSWVGHSRKNRIAIMRAALEHFAKSQGESNV